MKLCFLIADISGKGGTERVTAMIAGGLAKRGHEVCIIACRGDSSGPFPLNEEVKIYSLHAEMKNNPLLRKINNYKKIWTYVSKTGFDAVIAVDIYLYLYLFPLQLMKKCKCIAWEHFNYYISSMKSSKLARNLAVKYADKVVLLGKNDIENYKAHYKKADNFTYIYNPVAFHRAEYKKPDIHRIIAAGRLTEQKGFDLLVDVWKILESNKDLEQDWVLDIYGSGEQEELLRNKIREYGLKRIRLKGFTNDLEAELINSSIFVLSSRYEGFALVLLEAQSKGLPCVSFNCREGPAEIIEDGVNGFLVEGGNTGQMAEKLKIIMDDRQLRIKFASMSQKNLDRFGMEQVLREWEKLLKQVIEE